MWTAQGELLAVIDRGDAGWGDPALDFDAIPLEFVPAVLEDYSGNTESLGEYPRRESFGTIFITQSKTSLTTRSVRFRLRHIGSLWTAAEFRRAYEMGR
jgi:hypothetical protein